MKSILLFGLLLISLASYDAKVIQKRSGLDQTQIYQFPPPQGMMSPTYNNNQDNISSGIENNGAGNVYLANTQTEHPSNVNKNKEGPETSPINLNI